MSTSKRKSPHGEGVVGLVDGGRVPTETLGAGSGELRLDRSTGIRPAAAAAEADMDDDHYRNLYRDEVDFRQLAKVDAAFASV